MVTAMSVNEDGEWTMMQLLLGGYGLKVLDCKGNQKAHDMAVCVACLHCEMRFLMRRDQR